jgi:predicted Zn-dependent peptidase
VQIDKTAEAMAEMQRELVEYASGKRPPAADEVERIRKLQTLSLPGAFETAASVMGTIGDIVRYGRPDDYIVRRKAEVESLTPEQVKAAATALDPKAMTWVVVGDLKQTEAKVRALNLGEVIVVDADGKPVAPTSAQR